MRIARAFWGTKSETILRNTHTVLMQNTDIETTTANLIGFSVCLSCSRSVGAIWLATKEALTKP